MKKILPLLFFILPQLCFSGIIQRDQAFNAANNFLKSYSLDFKDIDYETVLTNDETGENLIYVFNINPKGFVLVSADSNVEPILGFSIDNNFETDNLSPSIHEWLKSYKNQIKFVKKEAIRNEDLSHKWDELLSNSQPKKELDKVGPLTVSKWHQGGGYNQDCPYDESCGNLHPPAGCVAIAMAQIIYYYKFPSNGTGSHSYNSSYGILSADFENTFYDYNKMASDVYFKNDAVAQLVYHCGVSTEMSYSPLNSGTSTGLVDNALINNFKYSPGMEFITKSNYEDLEWEQLLKNNLIENQIIMYRGSGGWSGHAWLCDGYMDNNYFHFNFGWGGSNNGYYVLDAIQVGDYDFTNGQQAIINIYPDTVNYNYPEIQSEYLFTSLIGSFSDGSKAEDYTSNYSGSYFIDLSNEAASEIFIQFDRIHTQTEKDMIHVYAGPDENSELIASLSGLQEDILFETPGSQVFITFSTDHETNMNGWDLSYHSLPYCSSIDSISTNFDFISDGSGNLPYAANSNCKWLIQPEETEFDSIGEISFEFKEFDVSLEDELIFYNGTTEDSEIIASINGNSPPDSLVIPSNVALVHFKTNQQQDNDGWKLKYHTRGPVYCSDTTLITSASGSINDGSVNSKWYMNHTDCYWRIAPPNAAYVDLTFTSYDVEFLFDYIEFFDPSTSPPTLIKRHHETTLPEPIRSESGQMLIHFHTDYAITGQGWEGNFTSGETGITENSLSKIKYYPNPVKDLLTIEIPTDLNNLDYCLYDMLGNIVLEKKSLNQTKEHIKLDHLPNGLFILQLRDKKNIIFKRIIKSE